MSNVRNATELALDLRIQAKNLISPNSGDSAYFQIISSVFDECSVEDSAEIDQEKVNIKFAKREFDQLFASLKAIYREAAPANIIHAFSKRIEENLFKASETSYTAHQVLTRACTVIENVKIAFLGNTQASVAANYLLNKFDELEANAVLLKASLGLDRPKEERARAA